MQPTFFAFPSLSSITALHLSSFTHHCSHFQKFYCLQWLKRKRSRKTPYSLNCNNIRASGSGDGSAESGPGPVPPFPPHSEMMRAEVTKLINDQNQLLKLGRKWKRFDNAGKHAYLNAVRDVCERWDIYLKRFELAEDFQSEYFLVWLDNQLERTFGMTRQQMRQNAYDMLQKMESSINDS